MKKLQTIGIVIVMNSGTFSIIPSFFKVKLTEDLALKAVHEDPEYKNLVSFEFRDEKYLFKNVFDKIYKNISWYFKNYSFVGSKIKGFQSPIEFLSAYNVLDSLHYKFYMKKNYYGETYISGVLVKTREDAKLVLSRINEALILDYQNLESKLNISLFLSKCNLSDFSTEDENVIVGTKHLSSYFSGEFKSNYFFRTFKITEVLRESPLALELRIRIHTEISGNCHICGKSLTDEFSKKTGIGPVCAKKYLGIKGNSIEETVKKIKQISSDYGEIGPVVIPKSQIRKL